MGNRARKKEVGGALVSQRERGRSGGEFGPAQIKREREISVGVFWAGWREAQREKGRGLVVGPVGLRPKRDKG